MGTKRSMKKPFLPEDGKEVKQEHTLQNCKGCYAKFGEAQQLFPQGPHIVHNPIVCLDIKQLQSLRKKQATCEALGEINAAFSERYNTTLTDSMVKHGQDGVKKDLLLT